MKVEEFDAVMGIVAGMERIGREALRTAEDMEVTLLMSIGIRRIQREPGFPCWQINGVQGYFNTPRQAVAALAAWQKGQEP